MNHFLPFHSSADRSSVPLGSPTASQPVADGHDTLNSSIDPPLGMAGGTFRHFLPFHSSAVSMPTARHAFADEHEIANSSATAGLPGPVISLAVQSVPFQVSAKRPCPYSPMATQNCGDEHDKPSNPK